MFEFHSLNKHSLRLSLSKHVWGTEGKKTQDLYFTSHLAFSKRALPWRGRTGGRCAARVSLAVSVSEVWLGLTSTPWWEALLSVSLVLTHPHQYWNSQGESYFSPGQKSHMHSLQEVALFYEARRLQNVKNTMAPPRVFCGGGWQGWGESCDSIQSTPAGMEAVWVIQNASASPETSPVGAGVGGAKILVGLPKGGQVHTGSQHELFLFIFFLLSL